MSLLLEGPPSSWKTDASQVGSGGIDTQAQGKWGSNWKGFSNKGLVLKPRGEKIHCCGAKWVVWEEKHEGMRPFSSQTQIPTTNGACNSWEDCDWWHRRSEVGWQQSSFTVQPPFKWLSSTYYFLTCFEGDTFSNLTITLAAADGTKHIQRASSLAKPSLMRLVMTINPAMIHQKKATKAIARMARTPMTFDIPSSNCPIALDIHTTTAAICNFSNLPLLQVFLMALTNLVCIPVPSRPQHPRQEVRPCSLCPPLVEPSVKPRITMLLQGKQQLQGFSVKWW